MAITPAQVVEFINKATSTPIKEKKSPTVLKSIEVRDFLIKYHFNNDTPFVPDSEFDKLDNWLVAGGIPKNVGEPVELKAGEVLAEHEHWFTDLLGTLPKIANWDDFKVAVRKGTLFNDHYPIINRDKTFTSAIFASPKIDGCSIALTFEFTGNKGKCIDATTRGKDGKGKNLIRHFKDVSWDSTGSEPNTKINGTLAIKFEASVTWSDLARLKEEQGLSYKSCRSAAAALCTPKNAHLACKYLTLVPLDVKAKKSKFTFQQRVGIINQLQPYFKNCNVCEQLNIPKTDYSNLLHYYDNARAIHPDFQLDGIVLVRSTDTEVWTGGEPSNMVAVKFPAMEQVTTITNFTIENGAVGGRITVMAHFKPVVLNGHTYSKTAILSHKRWKELIEGGIGIGCTITFSLRHDVMGYIDILDNSTTIEVAHTPDFCPICCSPLEENDTGNLLECINPDCDNNISGKAATFFKRIGIKGVRQLTIQKMIEADTYKGMISILAWAKQPDAFTVTIAKDTPGVTEKTTGKICNDLHQTLIVDGVRDFDFMSAMAIPSMDANRFRVLFRHIDFNHTFGKLCIRTGSNSSAYLMADIAELKDIILSLNMSNWGEGLNSILFKWLDDERNARTLAAFNMYCKIISSYNPDNMDYADMSVCVTGSCKVMARKLLETQLKDKGITVASGVSKKTNYLITDDSGMSSAKAQKAIQNSVPVISSAEAVEIFKLELP